MEMRRKSIFQRSLICFLFSLIIASGWNRSFASSKTTELKSAEISTILSVLGDKMVSSELEEKIKDKLSTLEPKRVLLIASLSERIASENRTTGAEIAFLLITALIVFS
ncbi:MAG: hypothetical protein ABSB22_15935 [Thermodesulfobacteriota bacterium]